MPPMSFFPGDHPALTREGLKARWYCLYRPIPVFSLDPIDLLIQEDRNLIEVPHPLQRQYVWCLCARRTADRTPIWSVTIFP